MIADIPQSLRALALPAQVKTAQLPSPVFLLTSKEEEWRDGGERG